MKPFATLITIAVVSLALVVTRLFGQQEETIYDNQISVATATETLYPSVAAYGRIEGVVVIKVQLADDGRVTSASAITGNGVLIAQCIPDALRWRFKPNTQKQAVIVYNFRLTEKTCDNGLESRFQRFGENFVTISACRPPPER